MSPQHHIPLQATGHGRVGLPAGGFLRRKMTEYEAFKAEIESLERKKAPVANVAPAPRDGT